MFYQHFKAFGSWLKFYSIKSGKMFKSIFSTLISMQMSSPIFDKRFLFFKLDVLVHRLVTLLADIGDSKSAESRVSDANLACRKLAVSHPILLLR